MTAPSGRPYRPIQGISVQSTTDQNDIFNGKTVLVTGGTGSFGTTVTQLMQKQDVAEIRIFSRDEQKQGDMRRAFGDDRIKFYLGDVRDASSVKQAVVGTDFIFHAAALKQVPSCEFHPLEAVKTNVVGTENVLDAADSLGVSKIICLSTDKAVYPVNAMGMSKALMEKVMTARARNAASNIVCSCTRYGNVMASRGSVIPLFVGQVSQNQPITVTDPEMTRFMMTLENAVDLVLFAFNNAVGGDIHVQKSFGVRVDLLANAVRQVMGKPDHEIKIIGTRHGEKRHETLLSREELHAAEDLGDYYRVPSDVRGLNYSKYFDKGTKKITTTEDYNSSNTEQMGIEQTKTMLRNLPFMKPYITPQHRPKS